MKIREAHLVIAAGVVLAFVAIGCNEDTKNKPVSQEASTAAPAPAPASPGSDSASAPASSANAPSGAPSRAAAGDVAANPPAGSITGKVIETMDSGGYTYMKLSSGGGEVWVAVNAAKVKKGQTVTVVNAMAMDGFESKTLHRKFDRILFGSLAVPGAEGKAPPIDSAAAQQGQMPPGHPDASDPKFREMMASQHAAAAQGPADVGSVKVPKAEGGKTVAEICSERRTLADQEVIVRGKVVKFLPEIMGRNWLHIRDGSGTAEAKDNDLTVTTSETAAIGDIVVVKGTVKIDQNFGAGYAYPVLIEKAKIAK
jgi:biotin carboxyl carrier protein